jgi:hypothetical protein
MDWFRFGREIRKEFRICTPGCSSESRGVSLSLQGEGTETERKREREREKVFAETINHGYSELIVVCQ